MLEIERLANMLKEAGIPFDRDDDLSRILDQEKFPYMRRVHYPQNEDWVCSAIQGYGSYGYKDNLIEIMGLASTQSDGVEGGLTAEEVFQRIKAHWEKQMNKIKKWTNEFTKECDKFLINVGELSLYYGYRTYLWGNEKGVAINENNYISFRVPGATRGGIKIVDNIIVDVVFDEEMCFGVVACYKKEIEPYIKAKFIGTKFDLPIVEVPKGK